MSERKHCFGKIDLPRHKFAIFRDPIEVTNAVHIVSPHAYQEFDWECWNSARELFGFIAEHRLQSEPDVWDILIDLFPQSKDRIEEVMLSVLRKALLASAGRKEE